MCKHVSIERVNIQPILSYLPIKDTMSVSTWASKAYLGLSSYIRTIFNIIREELLSLITRGKYHKTFRGRNW